MNRNDKIMLTVLVTVLLAVVGWTFYNTIIVGNFSVENFEPSLSENNTSE